MKIAMGKTVEVVLKDAADKTNEQVLAIWTTADGKDFAATNMSDDWKLLLLIKRFERAMLDQVK